METISAIEVNAILNELTAEPKSIRALRHSIHIGQYPGSEPLSRRIIEKSGIYSLILWSAPRTVNKYEIVRTRERLTSPLENIHFLRYVRLSPIASTTEVHTIGDDPDDFITTFKINEGALHFMDHQEKERHCSLENVAYVEADLKKRLLTFH